MKELNTILTLFCANKPIEHRLVELENELSTFLIQQKFHHFEIYQKPNTGETDNTHHSPLDM